MLLNADAVACGAVERGAVERGAVEPRRLSLDTNGLQSTIHLPIVDAPHSERLIAVICPRGAKPHSGAGNLLLPVAHPKKRSDEH